MCTARIPSHCGRCLCSFFISATRLSVRNIHTNIDEKKLREIFIAAVPVVDHNKPVVIKKVGVVCQVRSQL